MVDKEINPKLRFIEISLPYSEATLSALVEFCYAGRLREMQISLSKFLDLWQLAEMINMESLKVVCRESLDELFANNPRELAAALRAIWDKPGVSHSIETYIIRKIFIWDGGTSTRWKDEWKVLVDHLTPVIRERLKNAQAATSRDKFTKERVAQYATLLAQFIKDGSVRDDKEIVELLQQALKILPTYAPAQYLLSLQLEKGHGIPKNESAAAELLGKASEDPRAHALSGYRLYMRWKEFRRNYYYEEQYRQEAIRALVYPATSGSVLAQSALGAIHHETWKQTDVYSKADSFWNAQEREKYRIQADQSQAEAKKWLEKAKKQGDINASNYEV